MSVVTIIVDIHMRQKKYHLKILALHSIDGVKWYGTQTTRFHEYKPEQF